MKSFALFVPVLIIGAAAVSGCGRNTSMAGPGKLSGGGSGGGEMGGGGGSVGNATVSDAGGSPHSCADLFDQSVLQTYSFEISADNWAKLDADFHDLKDVLAGTPPQTFYPVTFHFGSETVSNAAVRLRGKSSWVQTVMYDANPKMQFVISFDQIVKSGKFHGLSALHFEIPRDDWTFLNDRIGNNWLRKVGLTAPCTNSAKLIVNGSYYGLYAVEGGVTVSLLKDFFPGNFGGDLFKGGTEADTNVNGANWARLGQLQAATTIAAMQPLVDLPNTVLEWAAEAVVNDADGYYGGAHNFYLYDEGAAGYVWLPDHTDSAFEWTELFTPLAYKQHPIYWWAGRPSAETPAADYLIVMNDSTWRSRYVDAIATQVAKWDPKEILSWIDAWEPQIADAVAADPRKWATADQHTAALAAMRDVVSNRPQYLQSFVDCERGNASAATDQDNDGVPWCNDCNDGDPAVHPGVPEICGNGIDDNCDGVIDEGCPGGTSTLDAGTP